MSISLGEKVARFLQDNPGKYTAKKIAAELISLYPVEFKEKQAKSGLSDEKLIAQVAAEVAAKPNFQNLNIGWDESPRPQHYYYKSYTDDSDADDYTENQHDDSDRAVPGKSGFSEEDMYQPLMDFMAQPPHNLRCMRINEKTSKHDRGAGGNRWLHPDIVGMQPVDKDWCTQVRDFPGHSADDKIRLFSFEVKKDLSNSNFRQSFFQAVSNSSWAHEAYLVAPSVPEEIADDLRMLSALHGVGVIILNMRDELKEGEMFLPARRKQEVDWESVNRLADPNQDFKNFLDKVKAYLNGAKLDDIRWM